MTRYYLEVRYRVTPVAAVDKHTDAMMDALVAEPNLIDTDIGADLSHGWADVCTVVEGEDEANALRTALVGIRSAAHNAGAATPGWEADLDKVMATVRPVEFPLDDDYEVPTQPTGEPMDRYADQDAGS
ncbi:MAG TPA: hypothetical protein VFO16_09040 [Pseudonocardiaceae bacterium]|nr:hypothetical protein [Pseudonocardiaceae bacterium]